MHSGPNSRTNLNADRDTGQKCHEFTDTAGDYSNDIFGFDSSKNEKLKISRQSSVNSAASSADFVQRRVSLSPVITPTLSPRTYCQSLDSLAPLSRTPATPPQTRVLSPAVDNLTVGLGSLFASTHALRRTVSSDSSSSSNDIASALHENNTLTELKLCSNNICDEGVDALCEAIKVNTSLRKLMLANNMINSASLQKLVAAVEVNKSFIVVDIVRSMGSSLYSSY